MTALLARLRGQPRPPRGPAHQIVILARALLLFESAMYSALTPVLPHYAHMLHAAKPGVGVLTASYPAGLVPGSIIGAWIATRAGVRRTVIAGLVLFAVSIAGFGFAREIVTLDVLRVIQGAASGFIWGGGMTWVIAVAPRERRGAVLGSVFAAAIFGTLLGPVLGTLAVTVGTRPVFALVGLASLALAGWTLRHCDPPSGDPATSSATPLRALLRNRRIALGTWLIILEAATVGATGTLLPLRLARFGASGVLIGATFLIASLLSMQVTGPIGRTIDRSGPARPLYAGLTLTAILMAALTLPTSAVLLAILSMIALGGPLTAYTTPSMSVITDAAEHAGIPLALATLMLNLAWALGEVIGAPAAASLSAATSDAVPLLGLSVIMVLALPIVVRAQLNRSPDAGPDAEPAVARPARTPVRGSRRLASPRRRRPVSRSR